MEPEQREQKTNVNKQKKKENKRGDGDFLRGRLSVFTSHLPAFSTSVVR